MRVLSLSAENNWLVVTEGEISLVLYHSLFETYFTHKKDAIFFTRSTGKCNIFNDNLSAIDINSKEYVAQDNMLSCLFYTLFDIQNITSAIRYYKIHKNLSTLPTFNPQLINTLLLNKPFLSCC